MPDTGEGRARHDAPGRFNDTAEAERLKMQKDGLLGTNEVSCYFFTFFFLKLKFNNTRVYPCCRCTDQTHRT